jgi:hypothetical protein
VSPAAAGLCAGRRRRRMGESACQKKRPQRKGGAAGAVIPTDARGGEASGRLIASRREAAPAGAWGAELGPPIPAAGKTKAADGQPNYRNSVDRSELVWSTSVGGLFRSWCSCLARPAPTMYSPEATFHAPPLDETVFRHRRSRPETDVSLHYWPREGSVSVFVFEILIF